MKSSRVALAGLTLIAAAPVAVEAQITAGAQPDPNEIIVTARKRQESILNTPVIETAIPAAQLDRRQTIDLKDIGRQVPGLALGQGMGALGTQVSLRGIGTSAINAGIDASVSLNLDGLQVTQAQAYASAVFDLAQVEVLKGPQSLFYGKNSPGGVIAIRSADATDTFEVIGRYGYEFEAREHRGELVVSGPITDTLRLRIAGAYDSQDGYFHNITTVPAGSGGLVPRQSRFNGDKNWVVRGTAIFRPTSSFDARLKVNVTHDKLIGGDAAQYVSCPDGVNVPITVAGQPRIFLGGAENCKLDRSTTNLNLDRTAFPIAKNGGVLYHTTAQQFGSLELNYRPRSDLTVSSTTGFYRMNFQSMGNGSGSTFAGPSFSSLAAPLVRRDLTQELRISSDFSSPLNFVAGAYYQDGYLNNHINLEGNRNLGLATLIAAYQEIVHIKSYSAFGQLRWKITPELELAGGGRYTDERRRLDAYNWITGTPIIVPTAVPKIHSSNFAPEVTLTYKPTTNATVFAAYKQAYKSGTFTLTSLPTPAAAALNPPDYHFGDEKAQGGEIGLKLRLLDRRLNTTIAFYNYKYTGLQVGAVLPTAAGGVPVNATLNAGAARTYGIDFDVSYRPAFLEGLGLNAAVNWDHARFIRLNNVPCYGGQTIAAGCNQLPTFSAAGVLQRYTAQDLAGKPLIRAPNWQVNFGVDYEMPVGHDMKIVLAQSNQFSSRYLSYLGLRPDFYRPSFFKYDLTATLHGPRDRWEFAVVGKNLGNRLTSQNCLSSNAAGGTLFGGQVTGTTASGPAGVDEVQCYLDRGREVWLRVTLRPFN